MSMHLVFRDLDKVHVIQHLRLQGDGNDGEEEAEKQADVEVEPPKDQDSKLEKKVMMYKLRLLGVHAEDEKSKVIADVSLYLERAAAELVDWAIGHSEDFSSS